MADELPVPDHRDEANFMLAAEKSIASLQVQATAAKKAADEAKASAETARKSANWWKKLTVAIAVFTVLLLGSMAVGGYYVQQTRANASGLRQQTIAACDSGNQQRQQLDQANTNEGAASSKVTELALHDLILALEGKRPTPAVLALAKTLEAQIKHTADMTQAEYKKALDKATAPHDCSQIYRNTTGSGSGTTAGIPKADDVAVTWTVVQLRNWNGACLTVANANVGTRISQTSCSHAHDWVYGSNGQLSPQGHKNVAAGDSGGHMVLKAPGTKSLTNDVKRGPSGLSYDRMSFGVHGTYWHGNGAGKNVSLVAANSNADYWAILNYATTRNATEIA